MNKYLHAIVSGAKASTYEAPRLYFAPIIVLLAWMLGVSERGAGLRRSTSSHFLDE